MKNKSLLINFPLIELTRRVFVSGDISARGIGLLVVYYIKLILVLPAAFLQTIFYSRRISKTAIAQNPVFILGHYRSGTTYLHKLTAADKRFGFITYYDIICPNTSLLFGKWLQRILQVFINNFKIKTAFFNNTIPSLSDPAEEERFLINKGSVYADYWRFVFPLSAIWQGNSMLSNEKYYHRREREYTWLLKLITYKNKGRQLLLKSPPNTERIKYLLKLFPNAKFIYINRNPYHVFYSMRYLWDKALRKFCLQNITDEQIEEIIFTYYASLMEQYEKDKKLIPAGNLVEVQYEALEAHPLRLLESIYNGLNLADFSGVKKEFLVQLSKEKKYCKFSYNYQKETYGSIDKRWAAYIHQWNRKAAVGANKVYC